MASLNEIRSTFIDYFAQNGHEPIESSSLVPQNDPTLLFTSAGMVQFKNVFTGLDKRAYNRAVTSQKCLRAGGKHNDLDNVGYTARHHTFFEMLGNFSFGDYFKEQAIEFAWELITKEFGLPPEKLLVTVYHTDDEAAEIWRKITGFPDSKIIRIDTSDNFWAAGPTGPCGPCSEIFYDHGDHIEGGPPGSPDEDGDRFIEIWNLVFMQYDQISDGVRENLPSPSIDTGMGLERIGALLQGKHDNYDTDLMRALIEAAANAMSTDPDGPGAVHHRVISDHLRATSFMMADGVMPSNEGRGYVLRRIIRRAVRHAHLLGEADPVMHRLVPALVAQMGQAFPELGRAQAMIEDTLKSEETRFRATLTRGLALLDDAVTGLPEGDDLPGETAFKLYDTFGFPLDLTQDAMREAGRGVDAAAFETAMEAQRAKARAAWSGSGDAADDSVWFGLRERHGATEFLGYSTTDAEGFIQALVADGVETETLRAGQSGIVVASQSPFYGESGGQVGDTGTLSGDGAEAEIIATGKKLGDLILHEVQVTKGELSVGTAVRLRVDPERRARTAANHTATHLLHEALRGHLGDHVAQRGSLVAPDRLRFDFVHQMALEDDELKNIESEVNQYIRQNTPVVTRLMTPDDAVAEGARALFGEKYGDEVRVVSMGTRPDGETGPAGDIYSLELCGGTHAERTGEIGALVVTAEAASSSGIRRIEALTGAAAFEYLTTQDRRMGELAALLKAKPEETTSRARAILDERKSLQNEVAELRKRLSLAEANASDGQGAKRETRLIGDIPFFAQTLHGVTAKDLRGLVDEGKAQFGSAAILLLAENDGKVAVAAGVTEDLVDRVKAGDMIRTATAEMGGKGGGRPDFAQGGGEDPTKIDAAVAAVEAFILG